MVKWIDGSYPREVPNGLQLKKGTYSIIAYQDVNNNGKVDLDGLVIAEPWQCFRERDAVYEYPLWDQVKFDLKEDMKGIEIKM